MNLNCLLQLICIVFISNVVLEILGNLPWKCLKSAWILLLGEKCTNLGFIFFSGFSLPPFKVVSFCDLALNGDLVSPVQVQRIEELNELDMELYDYARDLFQQRYQYTRQQERWQQRIKNHMQQSHQGLGLSVGLWPSRGQASSQSTLEEGDRERGEREEREDGEEGGRTEEAGARLPTEDYMNQIIKRW